MPQIHVRTSVIPVDILVDKISLRQAASKEHIGDVVGIVLSTTGRVPLAEAIARCIESIRLCLTVAVVYCFQAVPFVRTVLLSATGTAGSDLTKSASSRLGNSQELPLHIQVPSDLNRAEIVER